MKQDIDQLFYSKILLFGEYSLIVGSMALSIPFHHFSGRLIRRPEWQIAESGKRSNFQLDKFAGYLENILQKNESNYSLDLLEFKEDISKGLVFQSNIPEGYGLGSSGALVAAIYSAYGRPGLTDFTDLKNLPDFKNFLAKMESYFHGKSSGLDPLISLLNKPLLLDESGEITIAGLPEWQGHRTGTLFLVDSGSKGETRPLVDRFLEDSKDPEFMNAFQSDYIPVVNRCINAYCSDNIEKLFAYHILLSEYQFRLFHQMIPQSIRKIWQQGLKTEKYSLKLCGSGGGGMILGLTKDFKQVKAEIKNLLLTEVHPV